MAIAYKTGVECLEKRGRYYIFHNEIMDTFGYEKDVGQDIVRPPFCDWLNLEQMLKHVEGLRQSDWEEAMAKSATRAVND